MGKLEQYGIINAKEHLNWSQEQLIKNAVSRGEGRLTNTGALAINTGKFTGRSPKDRFIVKDDLTKDTVWWGEVNIEFDTLQFDALQSKMVKYLSNKEIFVHDGAVCTDNRYKLKVRTISEYDWSSLFVQNMFLRLKADELENFGDPDWLIICAPGFEADPTIDGTRQANFSILNFSKKIALIGGSGYTGEMKKGVFSALNFLLPKLHGVFPMHCSANVGTDGDTAIFFGLSGTGKTTLSADPNRKLIGDDEHGWSPDNKIFNFEGGCYAKTIDITPESEPEIYKAIVRGALLENIGWVEGTNIPDYTNIEITQNTRVSYPIENIDNIQPDGIGQNPKNIFFLTFDAFGVIPALSKLTPEQAAYYFISGYTSKVAGTEEGINEPQTTFSACFGAPFMPLHPSEYAQMLSKRVKESGANVWMINTGLNGSGNRFKLSHTRALISSALNGSLSKVTFESIPYFNFKVPTVCEGVPSEWLNPINTWSDKEKFHANAKNLTHAFQMNFKKFESLTNDAIINSGPQY